MENTQPTVSDEGSSYIHAPTHHRTLASSVQAARSNGQSNVHAPMGSSEARGQELISTSPLMPVMKYMPPSALIFVSLKYQGKPEVLFQENPAPVWCFLVATCVYWLIVGAMKQMSAVDGRRFQTFRHAAVASGILSAISLVSVFLPYPVSLLPVTILISLLVVSALPYAYRLLHRGITNVVNKIHAIVVWARGLISSAEEASSPV